jgi:hypothetical protein
VLRLAKPAVTVLLPMVAPPSLKVTGTGAGGAGAYEASALDALQQGSLGEDLERHGALAGRYQLSYAASVHDLK